MKKIILLSVVFVLLAGLTSCNKEEEAPVLGADVKVTIKNLLGLTQEGVTVYMFKEEITDSTPKSEAKRHVVTNKDGVAEFKLNFTELSIIESQTSLYFGVYYTINGEDRVAGSSGITVERNKAYQVGLTIPL